jgi:uncharacterized protein (TIGR03437 family)
VDAPLGATTLTVGASAPFSITLVQYCPGLAADGTPAALALAFHFSAGKAVTAGFPAAPNEQIGIVATGLGATKPPYATGTAPDDANAMTVVKPAVNFAGSAATVGAAFAQPNGPGFYVVVFTVPANATTGNKPVTVSIGGLTSNTVNLPVATGPIVESVTNAASYIDQSLPNGFVAQGSIFVIKGNNLGPSSISIASTPFQNTTLSGTSVSITSGGATVAPLMYYTSANQLAALLPSNTPIGPGTLTVSYNGQPGPSTTIRVAPGDVGIFTVTSDGQGAGIVTYPDYSLVSATRAANCGGVNTTCGAANPGDVLIIWATGLGPVSGSDASGAGLGVNMTSLALTIWLGGVPVKASYQGRSGCCVGEDQIVFTVPPNTPTGCAVPLSIQIDNTVNGNTIPIISNSVSLPVAPAGGRTCTPADPTFTADNVVQVSSPGTFTFAELDMRHRDDNPGFDDNFSGEFLRFSIPQSVQPFFMSYADSPALGACGIYNSPAGKPDPPLEILGALDAGAQITVQGPNGSKSASLNGGSFNTSLSDTGSYLVPGTYTVSGPGGADVHAFNASTAIPSLPTMTSPPPDASTPFQVTRANGLTVTWSGGQANGVVELEGFSATDNTGLVGNDFLCRVPAAAGSFTIPPNILLALPAGNFGRLAFRPFANTATLTGSGLSFSKVVAWNVYFTPLAFR